MRTLLAMCLLAGIAVAVEEKKESLLEQVRAQYRREAQQALEPVQRKYVETLKVLQEKLATEGQLREALKVQEEAKSVSELLTTDMPVAPETVITRGPKLKIIKATWGRGDRLIDVTEKLQKMVRKDQLVLGSETPWIKIFGDPYHGDGKTLSVQYEFKGAKGIVELYETPTTVLKLPR